MLLFLIIILQAAVGIAHSSSTSSSTSSSSTTMTAARTATTTKRVGVVLSEGFELLDALGPYEALKEVQEQYYESVAIQHRRWVNDGSSGIKCSDGSLEVEAVLASFEIGSVQSSSGVSIAPEFDLSLDPEATHFDLLVLGAGSLDKSDNTSMNYLQHHHDRGGLILTVCTGAALVALLGFLDGTEATTNSLFIEAFQKDYPGVRWISLADNLERRFVRSTQQITTTAGITAGIDGTLHQIQEWCGREVAEATRQCLEWPLSIQSSTQTKPRNFGATKEQ